MKIVFFGTPHFAAEVLKYLLEHKIEVVGIVTQTDKPQGRHLQRVPSPVKQIAPSHIPLFQPEKASQEEFLNSLKSLNADLFVVVAYGQILSQKLLDIPPKGCINVHASLLPKFRGAAPMQRTLMAGEKETGIAIQKMVKQLDAGDVIAVAKMEIPVDMTLHELSRGLMELAKPLLLKVIREYEKGVPRGEPQDVSLVTYAPKVEVAEGEIHWDRPAMEIHNLIRGISPKPGAWVYVNTAQGKKRVKILISQIVDSKGEPGEILFDCTVACGDKAIKLIQVQQEGKKVMSGDDWLRGQKVDLKSFFI